MMAYIKRDKLNFENLNVPNIWKYTRKQSEKQMIIFYVETRAIADITSKRIA